MGRGHSGVARYEGVLLLGFILFFESGNEASIGGWTSTYVNSAGYSPRIATLVLAAYWGGPDAGQNTGSPVLHAFKKSRLIAGTGAQLSRWLVARFLLIGACVLVLHLPVHGLIGLSYGPIFPTTLAIAGDRYSKRAGTVFGLLFSIALIGGMLLPWAVGSVSQQAGVHAGMIVPRFGAVGITVLACPHAPRVIGWNVTERGNVGNFCFQLQARCIATPLFRTRVRNSKGKGSTVSYSPGRRSGGTKCSAAIVDRKGHLALPPHRAQWTSVPNRPGPPDHSIG